MTGFNDSKGIKSSRSSLTVTGGGITLLSSNSATTVTGRMCLELDPRISSTRAIVNQDFYNS